MPRYFGCHVSVAGGLEKGLERAGRLEINTIQCHPSPPQRWNSKPFPAGVEDAFNRIRKTSGVEKVFFHAIYLINLATPDSQKFHLAKMSLLHYLDLCDRIRGDGVIFHVGSSRDQADESDGLKRAAEGINWILEKSEHSSPLLLEVSAGSGAVIGDRMEELKSVYEMVEAKDRVGFALDTQHMWASGYEIASGLVDEVASVFGLDKVHAIHLNDSMTQHASRKDRHENIGKGTIGEKRLLEFLHEPRLKSIPFILETPAMKTPDEMESEVALLRQWVNKTGSSG